MVVEQIIRPTGLDRSADRRASGARAGGRPARRRSARAPSSNERVLVTTLTKRMAEDLTHLLSGARRQASATCTRTSTRSSAIEILRDLRRGTFDVLVGINLLREGLDLPEVSLVAVLDADKEGFLRSAGALIQTVGRAARNVNGRAILLCRQDDRFDAAARSARRSAAARFRRPTTPSTASRPRRSSSRSTT